MDTCYVTLRVNRTEAIPMGNSSYIVLPRYLCFWLLLFFFFIILISSAFELSYTHDFIPIPIMMTLVRICPTKLRVSLSYTRDYILIANFVGMALIPFAILTILNLKLFRTIKVVFLVFYNSSSDAQASLAPTTVSP